MKNMNKINIFNIKIIIIIVVLFSVLSSSYSQDLLTLKDAISIALGNNYSIKISRSQTKISDNNYSIGNAGFLPSIDLTGTQSNSIINSKQEYVTGGSKEANGATSNSINAAIALNWTIFDGMNMFIAYDQLEEFKKLDELYLRFTVENTLASVMNVYYDIVRQLKIISVAKETVALSEERAKITEIQYKLGAASKLDFLQSTVDLNEDKANLLNQEVILANLKVSMNDLLARDKGIDFDAIQEIQFKKDFEFNDLLQLTLKNNFELQISQKSKSIAKLKHDIEESKSFPKLSLFANYSYYNLNSEYGQRTKSTDYGLTYGLNLSYNIFDGLNNKRQIENAAIELEKYELSYNDLKSKIESELISVFNNYKKNIQLVDFEENNLNFSKENLEIAKQQIKLGTYSSLQFREAQKSYVSAQSRYISSQYSAKISEIELMRIGGIIVH